MRLSDSDAEWTRYAQRKKIPPAGMHCEMREDAAGRGRGGRSFTRPEPLSFPLPSVPPPLLPNHCGRAGCCGAFALGGRSSDRSVAVDDLDILLLRTLSAEQLHSTPLPCQCCSAAFRKRSPSCCRCSKSGYLFVTLFLPFQSWVFLACTILLMQPLGLSSIPRKQFARSPLAHANEERSAFPCSPL